MARTKITDQELQGLPQNPAKFVKAKFDAIDDDLDAIDPDENQLIDGANADVIADVNTLGGMLLLYRTAVPSGADGDVDITLPAGHKIRVVDAWAVMKGAGTTGSLLTLKSTASAISDAVDVASAGDKARVGVGEIDDANHEIAGGGILRWSKASAGADFPGAECYVSVIRVA